MPLTKPAMITLVILAFIGSWNEYLSPLIFITKQENIQLHKQSAGIYWMNCKDMILQWQQQLLL